MFVCGVSGSVCGVLCICVQVYVCWVVGVGSGLPLTPHSANLQSHSAWAPASAPGKGLASHVGCERAPSCEHCRRETGHLISQELY